MDQSLEEVANRIPSQGGVAIGPFLRKAAADAPAGTAIVEVGTWLGAGTAQLALGLESRTDPPVLHTYDFFQASPVHIEKAAGFGLEIHDGQDTLPIVKNYLRPFKCNVVFHKGNLLEKRWQSPPISVYIDDAAKTPKTFYHVMRTFGPHWIPGVTVLALMDFMYWEKRQKADPHDASVEKLKVQFNFINANSNCFEPIVEGDSAGTTARFFKYTKPIDFDKITPFFEPKSIIDFIPWKAQVSLRRLRRLTLGGQSD